MMIRPTSAGRMAEFGIDVDQAAVHRLARGQRIRQAILPGVIVIITWREGVAAKMVRAPSWACRSANPHSSVPALLAVVPPRAPRGESTDWFIGSHDRSPCRPGIWPGWSSSETRELHTSDRYSFREHLCRPRKDWQPAPSGILGDPEHQIDVREQKADGEGCKGRRARKPGAGPRRGADFWVSAPLGMIFQGTLAIDATCRRSPPRPCRRSSLPAPPSISPPNCWAPAPLVP